MKKDGEVSGIRLSQLHLHLSINNELLRISYVPEKRILNDIFLVLSPCFGLGISAHQSWVMQIHASFTVGTSSNRYESTTWQLSKREEGRDVKIGMSK